MALPNSYDSLLYLYKGKGWKTVGLMVRLICGCGLEVINGVQVGIFLISHQNIINKLAGIMYNQPQHPSPISNPNPPFGSPKFANQNYPRPFEKPTLPQTLKHYSSNPNLSLQTNLPKPNNYPNHDPLSYNHGFPLKAGDFHNQPNGPSFANIASQASTRNANRSEMTRSMIVNDAEKQRTPEDTLSPKRELFKNVPKRQYRMSQTIEDLPSHLYQMRREEPVVQVGKEPSFMKHKQVQKEKDEKKEVARQAPSFLNRVNSDMKRSMVVQSSYQTNPQFHPLKDLPKPKKKVSVDDFIKIKQLGSGKYGRVYLVKQKYCNFICALKVIEKKLLHEEEITDQFIREVKIQMFLNHPNIIKMYGCFHDAVNIYIILEVGTGGQLYHQLKKSQPLSQARIAFIMKQVCDAVNEIHSLRIIHRDIKPQNIVLHDNIIKLCDFGWSVHQDNKLRTTFCGTPLYVCPQILKGREYDQKIDIWSIGIMMYEMVVGENPFKITREQELIKIVKDQIKIPSYLFVSTEVRDFLDKCLQKNPNDRATIKQLINHPFFKKHQQKDKKLIGV